MEVTGKKFIINVAELRVSYPRRAGEGLSTLGHDTFAARRSLVCPQGSLCAVSPGLSEIYWEYLSQSLGWGNLVMWPVLTQLPPLGTSFFFSLFFNLGVV